MSAQEITPEDESKSVLYPCPECPAGVMRMEYTTYFTWLNDELITVPNFPAWKCDICGRRDFDPRSVTWLNTLLNPATGRSAGRRTRRRPRHPQSDQPQP